MGAASAAPLKLAVVGTGMGSVPHFQSIEDLAGEVELAWVCARNAERLAGVALPPKARRTTRLEDILEDSSVHAVLLLTPANTHLEPASTFLSKNPSKSAWKRRCSWWTSAPDIRSSWP